MAPVPVVHSEPPVYEAVTPVSVSSEDHWINSSEDIIDKQGLHNIELPTYILQNHLTALADVDSSKKEFQDDDDDEFYKNMDPNYKEIAQDNFYQEVIPKHNPQVIYQHANVNSAFQQDIPSENLEQQHTYNQNYAVHEDTRNVPVFQQEILPKTLLQHPNFNNQFYTFDQDLRMASSFYGGTVRYKQTEQMPIGTNGFSGQNWNSEERRNSVVKRRNRTQYTTEQLQELQRVFDEEQKYLSRTKRQVLAQKLNLSVTQVKVWFQNRRMKVNKENKSLTASVRVSSGQLVNSSHLISTLPVNSSCNSSILQPSYSTLPFNPSYNSSILQPSLENNFYMAPSVEIKTEPQVTSVYPSPPYSTSSSSNHQHQSMSSPNDASFEHLVLPNSTCALSQVSASTKSIESEDVPNNYFTYPFSYDNSSLINCAETYDPLTSFQMPQEDAPAVSFASQFEKNIPQLIKEENCDTF